MRRATLLMTLILMAASLTALADKKKGPGNDKRDNVQGTIWTYTITKGDKELHGQFRVFEKELFKGGDKIGTATGIDADETTLTITGFEELNGTAVITKTRRHPPGAAGTLTKTDGTKWTIHVTWKDG